MQQLLLQCKLDLLIKTLADRNQCQIYFFLLLMKAAKKRHPRPFITLVRAKKCWSLVVMVATAAAAFPTLHWTFGLIVWKKGPLFYLQSFMRQQNPCNLLWLIPNGCCCWLPFLVRMEQTNLINCLLTFLYMYCFYSALYIFLGTRWTAGFGDSTTKIP